MNMITRLFKKKKESQEGGGLVLFHTTHQAMRAEKVMREHGIEIRLVAPPVNKRIGCDLAIEFDLIEKMRIERSLREKQLDFILVTEIGNESPEPVSMVEVIPYDGGFTMVRAGNMKLTFNNQSGLIVNISGGGCPDVPYLYQLLIDRNLDNAPSPEDHGYTLCALMLNRAFVEARQLWSNR